MNNFDPEAYRKKYLGYGGMEPPVNRDRVSQIEGIQMQPSPPNLQQYLPPPPPPSSSKMGSGGAPASVSNPINTGYYDPENMQKRAEGQQQIIQAGVEGFSPFTSSAGAGGIAAAGGAGYLGNKLSRNNLANDLRDIRQQTARSPGQLQSFMDQGAKNKVKMNPNGLIDKTKNKIANFMEAGFEKKLANAKSVEEKIALYNQHKQNIINQMTDNIDAIDEASGKKRFANMFRSGNAKADTKTAFSNLRQTEIDNLNKALEDFHMRAMGADADLYEKLGDFESYNPDGKPAASGMGSQSKVNPNQQAGFNPQNPDGTAKPSGGSSKVTSSGLNEDGVFEDFGKKVDGAVDTAKEKMGMGKPTKVDQVIDKTKKIGSKVLHNPVTTAFGKVLPLVDIAMMGNDATGTIEQLDKDKQRAVGEIGALIEANPTIKRLYDAKQAFGWTNDEFNARLPQDFKEKLGVITSRANKEMLATDIDSKKQIINDYITDPINLVTKGLRYGMDQLGNAFTGDGFVEGWGEWDKRTNYEGLLPQFETRKDSGYSAPATRDAVNIAMGTPTTASVAQKNLDLTTPKQTPEQKRAAQTAAQGITRTQYKPGTEGYQEWGGAPVFSNVDPMQKTMGTFNTQQLLQDRSGRSPLFAQQQQEPNAKFFQYMKDMYGPGAQFADFDKAFGDFTNYQNSILANQSALAKLGIDAQDKLTKQNNKIMDQSNDVLALVNNPDTQAMGYSQLEAGIRSGDPAMINAAHTLLARKLNTVGLNTWGNGLLDWWGSDYTASRPFDATNLSNMSVDSSGMTRQLYDRNSGNKIPWDNISENDQRLFYALQETLKRQQMNRG